MNLHWPGLFKGPESLIAAEQLFTANWVDLGAQLDVMGAQAIAIYLNINKDDSTNMRVRMLCSHTAAGDEYTVPIRTVGAAVVQVEPEYVEFNVDEDRLMVIDWDLNGVVGYVQFQIQAGVVGVDAGGVLTAHVTTAARA